MTVINSLKQLWLYVQIDRIRPSLQCSSVVCPHAVMALKLSGEKEADTTVEGCEVSGASSEELTSVRSHQSEGAAVCLVFTLQAHGSVVWTKWPPPGPFSSHSADHVCSAQKPRILLTTVVKNISHALHRVIAIRKYYSSSIIKEHCIPTKTYLSFFPQFQHHPKFTSQVMVKTEVFSLVGQPFIYLIVAVCTLLASRAECACQEHCSLLPLDTGFNGLHPDKASTATWT